jgi:hypothetical protein
MNYFYKVKLTENKTLKFRELTVDDYKNLQKVCVESDINLFKDYTKILIDELCIEELPHLNLIDIFIILLSIRSYSVSDERTFTSWKDGVEGKIKINLIDIINKVYSKYQSISDEYIIEVEDFIADKVVIDALDRDNCIKYFIGDHGKKIPYTSDMKEYIPLYVESQIDDVMDSIEKDYASIILFTLYTKDNQWKNINFSLEENYIYDMIKIFLKDDLMSLYKNLYDLKIKIGISFEEHKCITMPEFVLYTQLFNEEQERQDEAEGGGSSNGPNGFNLSTPKS